ncbi:hypothetical protein ACFLVE_02900 [Chloroflexota bacterium]
MNESWINLLLIGLSVLVGGAITWLAARYHYVKAANELIRETGELRHLTTLVLRILENSGFAELNRDESGKIVGHVINLSGASNGTSTASAEAEVTHRKSRKKEMT